MIDMNDYHYETEIRLLMNFLNNIECKLMFVTQLISLTELFLK